MKYGCSLMVLAPLVLTIVGPSSMVGQEQLVPRAYLITPSNGNAVIVGWSFFDGGIDLNGTIPITGATGVYNIGAFSYYHSFGFFGRSANFSASLPYAVGTFSGNAFGKNQSIYRSGLVDFTARLSVNLIGGPAMKAEDFVKWRQKTILGASVKFIAPTGQYDPRKLVNWGINRWAVKPEIGYSHRLANWIFDGYAGAWFYTENPAFYNLPVPSPQTQRPIGSLEGHVSYDLTKVLGSRGWVSLDGNFWWGGITALSGISNLASKQVGSRVGVTFSLPFTNHQSVKMSYSDGTYIRFGGNYQSVSVAWQYSWLGWKFK